MITPTRLFLEVIAVSGPVRQCQPFLMNIFFCSLLEKFCPMSTLFFPVWVQVTQIVVLFKHFQVQARKRGVLWWGWGCFVYTHIPTSGV